MSPAGETTVGETSPGNLVVAVEESSQALGMWTQESKPRASFNFLHLLPIIFLPVFSQKGWQIDIEVTQVSVRCCVVLKMCCFEHVINVNVWNVILWLNPWDKRCYTMSGKMMWIVLSWTCYTYIIYMCFRLSIPI